MEMTKIIKPIRDYVVIEEVDTLVDVIEPYLLKTGFLRRTSRGRELTDLSLKHLVNL